MMCVYTDKGAIGKHLALHAVEYHLSGGETRLQYNAAIAVVLGDHHDHDVDFSYECKARFLLAGGFPALATACLVFEHALNNDDVADVNDPAALDAHRAITSCTDFLDRHDPATKSLHKIAIHSMLNTLVLGPDSVMPAYEDQNGIAVIYAGGKAAVYSYHPQTYIHTNQVTVVMEYSQAQEADRVVGDTFSAWSENNTVGIQSRALMPFDRPVVVAVPMTFHLSDLGGGMLAYAQHISRAPLHQQGIVMQGTPETATMTSRCLMFVFDA